MFPSTDCALRFTFYSFSLTHVTLILSSFHYPSQFVLSFMFLFSLFDSLLSSILLFILTGCLSLLSFLHFYFLSLFFLSFYICQIYLYAADCKNRTSLLFYFRCLKKEQQTKYVKPMILIKKKDKIIWRKLISLISLHKRHGT